MGIFFNKKNKKEEHVQKVIDNEYVIKNFKLEFSKELSSTEINQNDYLKIKTVFLINCEKDYCFDLKWQNDSYNYNCKFTPKSGRIQLSYDIFPNGIKNVNLKVIVYDFDGDKDEFILGDATNWKNNINNQFYLTTETKQFLLKVVDMLKFTNDINFSKKYVTNIEEFERMLKHIKYSEVSKNNYVNTVSQTSTNKTLLEAKKKELLLSNISRNSVSSNNYENDPLGEYIEKQKRK